MLATIRSILEEGFGMDDVFYSLDSVGLEQGLRGSGLTSELLGC